MISISSVLAACGIVGFILQVCGIALVIGMFKQRITTLLKDVGDIKDILLKDGVLETLARHDERINALEINNAA